jgi:hypothetical protein
MRDEPRQAIETLLLEPVRAVKRMKAAGPELGRVPDIVKIRGGNQHAAVRGIDHRSDLLRAPGHRVRVGPARPHGRKLATRLFGCPGDEIHGARLADYPMNGVERCSNTCSTRCRIEGCIGC